MTGKDSIFGKNIALRLLYRNWRKRNNTLGRPEGPNCAGPRNVFASQGVQFLSSKLISLSSLTTDSASSWMIRGFLNCSSEEILTPSCKSISAVDVHTAEHITEKCLMGGLCRDRTIILVTHHVALCLPAASYLVELSQGKVLHQGTIQDLQDQGVLQKVIGQENDHLPQALPDQESDTFVEEQAKAKLETVKSDGKLIKDEFRAVGRVSTETYWTYIRAAGIHCFFLTVLLLLLDRLSSVATQVSSNLCSRNVLRTGSAVFSKMGRSIPRRTNCVWNIFQFTNATPLVGEASVTTS
jgi:hypothetical protein